VQFVSQNGSEMVRKQSGNGPKTVRKWRSQDVSALLRIGPGISLNFRNKLHRQSSGDEFRSVFAPFSLERPAGAYESARTSASRFVRQGEPQLARQPSLCRSGFLDQEIV
jgi:hypothetical protein